MGQSAGQGELGQNKLKKMSGCQVSSSTDVNHPAGYLRSLSSVSSPSDCDCVVTSTSDCRLRIETRDFRENTTAAESVSSTTEETHFESATLIEELIIDVIH